MDKEKIQDDLRTGSSEPGTIDTLLERGVKTILPEDGKAKKELRSAMENRRLKGYLGVDPTGPDLHIGHGVPLRKLRLWQELGHETVLLGGGFTATIGDPKTGSTRTRLLPGQVAENMKDYSKQAAKILDLSPRAKNPVVIVNNYDWLSKMGFGDVVQLASNFTVQQMLGHGTYAERINSKKPLYLHEILYFLMQAEDAKYLQTHVQFGGSEQTFNIASGITLIKRELNRKSYGVITELIADAKGQKMGKTEGNIVAINAPPEVKFEAVMDWPDGAIPIGFELLTSVPMGKVAAATLAVSRGVLHPNDLKRALAFRITAELDGVKEASFAEAEYDKVYARDELPSRIKHVNVSRDSVMVQILVQSGLAGNVNEASRLIANRSVWVDGEIAKAAKTLGPGEHIVSIGKKSIKNARKISV